MIARAFLSIRVVYCAGWFFPALACPFLRFLVIVMVCSMGLSVCSWIIVCLFVVRCDQSSMVGIDCVGVIDVRGCECMSVACGRGCLLVI